MLHILPLCHRHHHLLFQQCHTFSGHSKTRTDSNSYPGVPSNYCLSSSFCRSSFLCECSSFSISPWGSFNVFRNGKAFNKLHIVKKSGRVAIRSSSTWHTTSSASSQVLSYNRHILVLSARPATSAHFNFNFRTKIHSSLHQLYRLLLRCCLLVLISSQKWTRSIRHPLVRWYPLNHLYIFSAYVRKCAYVIFLMLLFLSTSLTARDSHLAAANQLHDPIAVYIDRAHSNAPIPTSWVEVPPHLPLPASIFPSESNCNFDDTNSFVVSDIPSQLPSKITLQAPSRHHQSHSEKNSIPVTPLTLSTDLPSLNLALYQTKYSYQSSPHFVNSIEPLGFQNSPKVFNTNADTLVCENSQQSQTTSSHNDNSRPKEDQHKAKLKTKKIVRRKIKKQKTPRQILKSIVRSVLRNIVKNINQIKSNVRNLHVRRYDTLVLLVTTVIVIPIMRNFNMSPILGFLAAGVLLGPTGLNIITDLHASEFFAEFGVVFLLFEMGLELSTKKIKALRDDVFGLGPWQFFVTGAVLASASFLSGLSIEASIVIGGALSMSSSAFVLQLLAEKGHTGSGFGRASHGILLFHDLAVILLVVLTPLLIGANGGGLALVQAVSLATFKGVVALCAIIVSGKLLLEPLFKVISKSESEEAFVALILFSAIATSTLTHSLGLSESLGAFLGGVMIAETKHRHQVEIDIKPVRGLLLGLFFITVGFSIDLKLAVAKLGTVAGMVLGLVATKTLITTVIMLLLGRTFSNASRTGLLLAQGGELASVVLGLAQKEGVLPLELTQLLLLVTALTMAFTPALDSMGTLLTSRIQNNMGILGSRQDIDFSNHKNLVVVAGFGRAGQSICKMLTSKLIEYVAWDSNPTTVIEAKKQGSPVFFGDACKCEELIKKMGLQHVKTFVVTLDDQNAAIETVISIKRECPDAKIFVRAMDARGRQLLEVAGADAIISALVETSYSLGGAALLLFGATIEEVNQLVGSKRQEAIFPRLEYTSSKTSKTTGSSSAGTSESAHDDPSEYCTVWDKDFNCELTH